MSALRQWLQVARSARDGVAESAAVFVRDVGHGMLEVSHNTLALIGLLAVAVVMFATGRAELRDGAETRLFGWLQARQEARAEPARLLALQLTEPRRDRPRHRVRSEGADPAAGRRRALDLAPLPRGAGADQPPRARKPGTSASAPGSTRR